MASRVYKHYLLGMSLIFSRYWQMFPGFEPIKLLNKENTDPTNI